MPKITTVSYVNPYGDNEFILVDRGGIIRQYKHREIRMERFYFLGLRHLSSTKDSLTYSKVKR